MPNILKSRYEQGGMSDINDPTYLEQNPLPPEDVEEEISPMIAVHLSEHECLELDKIQGGMVIDEKTGFRSYRPLEQVLKDPAIRELFEDVSKELIIGGHVDPEVETLEKIFPDKLPKYKPLFVFIVNE